VRRATAMYVVERSADKLSGAAELDARGRERRLVARDAESTRASACVSACVRARGRGRRANARARAGADAAFGNFILIFRIRIARCATIERGRAQHAWATKVYTASVSACVWAFATRRGR